MRFLVPFFFPLLVFAQQVFVPKAFQDGRSIEQVILISDVDGVVREGVESLADLRVISAFRALLEHEQVDVTFISGTPIAGDSNLEVWRQGNTALDQVFGDVFNEEMAQGRVAIYGVLGGQRMALDKSVEVIDQYSLENAFEMGTLLIRAFLQEVARYGNLEQRALAKNLESEINALKLEDFTQLPTIAPKEFSKVICTIREYLDPEFRLIANGALIETQTSNPPWETAISVPWLRNEMERPLYLASRLESSQKQVSTGLIKRRDRGCNFLSIGKTNKGLATKKLIEEKRKAFPDALIVTIGDTQVDFPMHQNAHLAFHVGLERVWRDHSLPQCMMIRDSQGRDRQHLQGTLQVLELLKEGIGKSFYDLKYIPQVNPNTEEWVLYSINEKDRAGERAR